MKDIQQQYSEWLSKQEPLQVGKTYKLLHQLHKGLGGERVLEMTFLEEKNGKCFFEYDTFTIEIDAALVYFKIFNATLP